MADYVAELAALGRDDMYVYDVTRRLAVLQEECGWSVYGDIDADNFTAWRRRRQKTGSKQGHNAKLSNGASAKTMKSVA